MGRKIFLATIFLLVVLVLFSACGNFPKKSDKSVTPTTTATNSPLIQPTETPDATQVYLEENIKPFWMTIQTNNIAFVNIVRNYYGKEEKAVSRKTKLNGISAKANANREALRVIKDAIFSRIPPTSGIKSFQDNLISAIEYNIGYYTNIISISGEASDGKPVVFGGLNSAGGLATDRYNQSPKDQCILDSHIKLEPDLPVDALLEASDKLQLIIEKKTAVASLPSSTSVNIIIPGGGSSIDIPSRPVAVDSSRELLINYLDRYVALRKDTQKLLNAWDNGNRNDAIRNAILSGISARNSLRNELAGVSVSSEWDATKQNIISVLDYSATAFQSLLDGDRASFSAKSNQITELNDMIAAKLGITLK